MAENILVVAVVLALPVGLCALVRISRTGWFRTVCLIALLVYLCALVFVFLTGFLCEGDIIYGYHACRHMPDDTAGFGLRLSVVSMMLSMVGVALSAAALGILKRLRRGG